MPIGTGTLARRVAAGATLLASLDPIDESPACAELATISWVIEGGVTMLKLPVVAHGNVVTAGGWLAGGF
ncbi:hypothetical protein [Sphingomonas sp.]|uniref:hypothetical protein n=1 Tax=Sphingomonas sp. TaxID=28214 RepID=UPI0031CE170D